MKRVIAVLMVVVFTSLMAGCHSSMVIDGTRYEPIGVADVLADPQAEAPNVRYDVVGGNVFWSVILCPTIIVPIVLVGWYLWEPVGPAGNTYRPPAN
jgi:hypothetical protein